MSRKTKDERYQVSYYPRVEIREIIANYAQYGFASRNEMIDSGVQLLAKTLGEPQREVNLKFLRSVAEEAARKEGVRLYNYLKASFQETRNEADRDLGIALLRAYSRMKDPPIDTAVEAALWRDLIDGDS
ncbi:MAG TPA: hypothetical protein EYN91_04300 [Candidatus Melainabacteria bacterium]|jgi:glutaminase|nr:hypothetical protein [Candidatus Melainabacteria bacterium]HIN66164.1 hypothetical protein [Candidatus Obscuribacterales bacterium]